MLFLFGGTLYAGYLGYQWKRTREVGDEIRELKKQLPAVGADGVRPPSPVDSAIAQKETVGSSASQPSGELTQRSRKFPQAACCVCYAVRAFTYSCVPSFTLCCAQPRGLHNHGQHWVGCRPGGARALPFQALLTKTRLLTGSDSSGITTSIVPCHFAYNASNKPCK